MEAATPINPQSPQAPVQEREVSYEEGIKDADFDQAEAPQPEGQAQEQEDVVDLLRPKAEPREWKLGKGEYSRAFVQRPLSFIAKMQWFSLIGEVLDKAMSGDDRLSINNLFDAPSTGRGGRLTVEDFRDADTFVQAVGKLLVHAPDFLTKSYCIWLSVPDYERDYVKQLMELPPEEGGLTDEQGVQIIETFIDQNYEALDSFFRDKLAGLAARITARQKERAESRQSKR